MFNFSFQNNNKNKMMKRVVCVFCSLALIHISGYFFFLLFIWLLKLKIGIKIAHMHRPPHTDQEHVFVLYIFDLSMEKDISYRLQAKYTHTVHCANMYVHIHTHTLELSENTGKIFTKFIETLSNSLLWLRFLCVFIYIDSSTHHRAHKRGKSSRHN